MSDLIPTVLPAIVPYRTCTYENHVGDSRVPATDFKRTKGGELLNWCRHCYMLRSRRVRNTRRAEREAQPLTTIPGRPGVALVPADGPCDCCGGMLSLQHYIYGERGVGAASHKICDKCDLTARAAGDDPLRLLHVAAFLFGCRDEIDSTRTAMRLHRR